LATGKLHMDDEETFGYKKRAEFADATFTANFGSQGKLSNAVVVGAGFSNVADMVGDRMVERIIVMGVEKPPSKLSTEDGRVLSFDHKAEDRFLVIRKPELSALNNWTIAIAY
jgi:mannosyl-oligosaccharide alpha-1,3-glucosidase